MQNYFTPEFENTFAQNNPILLEAEKAIEEACGVTLEDMRSDMRFRYLVNARIIFAHICKDIKPATNLALYLRHSHATLNHWRNTYDTLIECKDAQFLILLRRVEDALQRNRDTAMPNLNSLSDIEWDTCWMAIRYAMGRQTISSATLPKELCQAYFYRWTDGQKAAIVRDLRQHLQDKARWNGESTAHFGDKNIDHPEWMKFLLCLDEKEHCIIKMATGGEYEGFKFNDKYYPCDWWRHHHATYFEPLLIESVIPKQHTRIQ